MAAIHSMGSNTPCPVCLIPKDHCPSILDTFDLRIMDLMKKAYQAAVSAPTVAEGETIMKAVRLRKVEVR